MTDSKNTGLRSLETAGACLLIMRFIFSPDWTGLTNIFLLAAAFLLLADRIQGKVFPLLLIASVALQAVDVVMGIIAMLSLGTAAMLLMIRTVLLGFFLLMFFMRFFGSRVSEKLLFISGLVCAGAELLLSAAGGCVELTALGQTALVFALISVAHIQKDEESDAADVLIKTGVSLMALCALTAMWGIAAGTGGENAFSSLYKVFASSVGDGRSMDLLHLLPGVNWNLFGGLAGTALGAYIFLTGRKIKN